MSGPATKPCKTRNKISISKLPEIPHSHEVKANKPVDHKNSLTSPILRASQPVMGMEIALATPKEVITQVPCELDAPKFPAMVGIATLAMVESRTCINVANERAIVIHASFDPVKGAVVTIAPPLFIS
ncbi:hypothetical protein PROVRETT_06623 [Providencia rettgeri DSM 1131]|nr:hypothetical protein PROVRETT_06623 [Providencia rettgeri DSM 1131]